MGGRISLWLAAGVTGALLVGYPEGSHAEVSFQRGNGNVYFAYKDTLQPIIERVYNSKSSYKGMFGWGWGSTYDTRLEVSADGSVVIHEFGSGAENRFSPEKFSQKELDNAVELIAEVAKKTGSLGTSTQLESYKKRLSSDASYRNDEWSKFLAQGKLEPRQLPNGTKLQSNRFNFQSLTRTQDGYERVSDAGKVEVFSLSGKLIKVITDKNKNSVTLTYGKDGHIQSLIDNFNRKLVFEFNNHGLVARISADNGKSAEYQYNARDEMVFSKDVDGNSYKYDYDTQGRHNLVSISYSDKTSVMMSYYGRENHENVKSVKDRDGTLTEYEYTYDAKDKGHSTVSVKVSNSKDEVITKNSYEYFAKYRASGDEWTYKLISNDEGGKTETIYNECCGLPLSIVKGDRKTTFEYDSKGHVIKKVTPDEVTELQYDLKAGKIARVKSYSPESGTNAKVSEFNYDQNANLVFAKNSDGKQVKLLYDKVGRLIAMVDQNKKKIQFKYNEESRPVEITDPAVGAITVSYSNSGEIKKVDSKDGRKVASAVSRTFQNLLEIVRPAGVSLSL